jgi:hypothetical protein
MFFSWNPPPGRSVDLWCQCTVWQPGVGSSWRSQERAQLRFPVLEGQEVAESVARLSIPPDCDRLALVSVDPNGSYSSGFELLADETVIHSASVGRDHGIQTLGNEIIFDRPQDPSFTLKAKPLPYQSGSGTRLNPITGGKISKATYEPFKLNIVCYFQYLRG